MSWEPGRVRVHEMINAREVEQVTPDLAIARRMLEDAGRHLATASQAKVAGDLSGAYQLAYDALRKSAASLLEAQGLRATSRGGHLAVQEVVTAQFGTTVRRASRAMKGRGRAGQLASLPLARWLAVVPAERGGEGVRRCVAGPAGDLGDGQLAGPQVVAGEGHPPVGQVLHGRLAK